MMTQPPNETGAATVVAVSGLGTIGAGNPVNLLGIYVGSVGTSSTVNLWTQTGNAVLTGNLVVSTGTFAANTFTRLPAYFPKGLTYNINNDTVNMTLFWNPAD